MILFQNEKNVSEFTVHLLNHYLSNFLSLRPMHHDDAGTDFGEEGEGCRSQRHRTQEHSSQKPKVVVVDHVYYLYIMLFSTLE